MIQKCFNDFYKRYEKELESLNLSKEVCEKLYQYIEKYTYDVKTHNFIENLCDDPPGCF